MPLPHWVARVNRRVTNRILEPLARVSPGFAVVQHSGRRSGRTYRTPVNVFEADRHLLVALTYGPKADWFRNARAGPAHLERRGRLLPIETISVVGRDQAWPHLPGVVRLALRLLTVRDFAMLSVATPGETLLRRTPS